MDEKRILIECGRTQGFVASVGAQAEIDTEGDENEESEDLEGEACYHYVVSCCGVCVCVGRTGGQSTTSCLE